SYSTGAVSSTFSGNAGGITAVQVNAASMVETYATGPISGGGSSGALVGTYQACCSNTGTYANNYWDTQTTNVATSGLPAGARGLSTSDLKSGALPSGFDPTVWRTASGQYPTLQWRTPTAGLTFAQRVSNAWSLPTIVGNSIGSTFSPHLSGLSSLADL